MAGTNSTITLKGNPVKAAGKEVHVNDACPEFVVTGTDLTDFSLDALKGKKVIVLTIPSVDTPVCALEARRFNTMAKEFSDDVEVLVVSRDLPFALKRWCGAEGIENLRFASDFKHRSFGKAFGVDLEDIGILARAAFVIDKGSKVVYADYVSEVGDEPDYDQIVASVKSA